MEQTQNLRVERTEPLLAPSELMAELPMTPAANATVVAGRRQVKRALGGDDGRMLVVVGPCSIHDPAAAMDYAGRLNRLSGEVADRLLLVMRVYFEKPRTTVGWKGLINDPHMNDTFAIADGLRQARRLLLDINSLGVPAATELLEPIVPQYIADLVSIAAIGARTTESPTHRQMASGLSMPVGFKNSTDGNIQTALDAMTAARQPHSFLGIDAAGHTCVIHTAGNADGFVIMRGGRSGTNYSEEHLADAASRLREKSLPPALMIDCSHANSEKDYRKQAAVWHEVLRQRAAGNSWLIGLMLESFLQEGNQKSTAGPGSLQYGVSVTDSCIGWGETEALIREAHELLR